MFAVGIYQHRDPQLARVQRIKGYRKFSPSENFINCSKDLEITAEKKVKGIYKSELEN